MAGSIPDMEVLQRVDMVSMYAILKRSWLGWTGHVCHVSDECLSKSLFYGELKADKCCHRGYKNGYKVTLKVLPEVLWHQS